MWQMDLEAAKGDNWRQIASDKRRHIATNSLPPFVAFCRSVSSRIFSKRFRWEMVSMIFCQRLQARRPRDIRIEPTCENVSINFCRGVDLGA
jgi:hypothetical protein